MPGSDLPGGDSILLSWAGFGYSSGALAFMVALAMLLSSYVKIATVLAIVRAGFGLYSLPSVFVTGGLAVGLSFFAMYPTLQGATEAAKRTAQAQGGALTDSARAAVSQAALDEWKVFLVRESKPAVRERFAIATQVKTPPSKELSESWRVVVPAFIVSQLEDAFRTGFMLLLPLLVVELLVGAVLLSLGATQVDTGLVSLPLKILLFVALDGWALITTNLVATYAQ